MKSDYYDKQEISLNAEAMFNTLRWITIFLHLFKFLDQRLLVIRVLIQSVQDIQDNFILLPIALHVSSRNCGIFKCGLVC
jgi:hypothetical protein